MAWAIISSRYPDTVIDVAMTLDGAIDVIVTFFHPDVHKRLTIVEFDQPMCGEECEVCLDGTFLPLGGCPFMETAIKVFNSRNK